MERELLISISEIIENIKYCDLSDPIVQDQIKNSANNIIEVVEGEEGQETKLYIMSRTKVG